MLRECQIRKYNRLKSMAFLFLLLLVESQAIDYQCTNIHAQFPSCTNNNSVLSVTKSAEMYRISLEATEWQCFNNFCLVDDQIYWQKTLMCNDTCGACRKLQSPGSINGKSSGACI